MISDLFNTLYWREPWALILLILPLLLIALNQILQKRQWKHFADKHLQPWLKAHNNQSNTHRSLPLLAFSWLFFVIALSGPRLIDWVPPEQQTKPATLIVVLDLSASMHADDAYPSRQAQAINWLTHNIKNKPKHLKIGLIVFAGHAFNLMPPTLDENIIRHFASQLSKLPLPTLGNNLSGALMLAKQSLSSDGTEQHIVILSDGDLSKTEQQRAHKTLKNDLNLTIHFIGLGGNTAVKIPKPNGGFVLSKGRPVQSRLQSTWLHEMASLPSVSYQHITDIQQQALKQTIQLKAPRLNSQAQEHVIWHELFSYPLVIALLLLIISLIRINPKHFTPFIWSVFFTSLLFSHSPTSHASNDSIMHQATTALQKQNYALAQKLFRQIDSVTADFGEAIACYRQKNFKCATRAFSKAAWQSKTKVLHANAVFNLGNSYFFLGDYEQASVLFKDAKNLGFDAKIAQKNLEFSNSMQQAVEQRILDIKEVFRRAKWRAAISGNPTPTLNNIISQQDNFSLDNKKQTQQFLIRKAINLQVTRQLGLKNIENTASQWIKTEHIASQSTAQLLKRLLEMELAIPAPLKEPQSIEGKRSW